MRETCLRYLNGKHLINVFSVVIVFNVVNCLNFQIVNDEVSLGQRRPFVNYDNFKEFDNVSDIENTNNDTQCEIRSCIITTDCCENYWCRKNVFYIKTGICVSGKNRTRGRYSVMRLLEKYPDLVQPTADQERGVLENRANESKIINGEGRRKLLKKALFMVNLNSFVVNIIKEIVDKIYDGAANNVTFNCSKNNSVPKIINIALLLKVNGTKTFENRFNATATGVLIKLNGGASYNNTKSLSSQIKPKELYENIFCNKTANEIRKFISLDKKFGGFIRYINKRFDDPSNSQMADKNSSFSLFINVEKDSVRNTTVKKKSNNFTTNVRPVNITQNHKYYMFSLRNSSFYLKRINSTQHQNYFEEKFSDYKPFRDLIKILYSKFPRLNIRRIFNRSNKVKSHDNIQRSAKNIGTKIHSDNTSDVFRKLKSYLDEMVNEFIRIQNKVNKILYYITNEHKRIARAETDSIQVLINYLDTATKELNKDVNSAQLTFNKCLNNMKTTLAGYRAQRNKMPEEFFLTEGSALRKLDKMEENIKSSIDRQLQILQQQPKQEKGKTTGPAGNAIKQQNTLKEIRKQMIRFYKRTKQAIGKYQGTLSGVAIDQTTKEGLLEALSRIS